MCALPRRRCGGIRAAGQPSDRARGPLAVPLSGEAAVAAVGPARQAQREREVDQCADRVNAFAVLLGAAGREDHRCARTDEQVRGGPLLGDAHPGDALDSLGPVGGRHLANLIEAGRPGPDVVLVDMASGDGDVQQTVGQRQIGAWRYLQMQRRLPSGRGESRIDDDERSTVGPLVGQPPRERRHRLGRVASHQQDRVRAGEVRKGERQATVDAEGSDSGSGRRRHAESAVVVDVAGAQRDSRELAQEVCLLVRQAPAAEHGDAVCPVGLLRPTELRGDPVQCLVPRHRSKRLAAAFASERSRQPLR